MKNPNNFKKEEPLLDEDKEIERLQSIIKHKKELFGLEEKSKKLSRIIKNIK